MRTVWVVVFVAAPLFGETITTNPVTPAPQETFTLTVRGSWADGCTPKFQNVSVAGMTIQIDAFADPCSTPCTEAVTAYAFDSSTINAGASGFYSVEYYVTTCSTPRRLVATQTLPIHFHCQFDRSLSANMSQVLAGRSFLLHWCDPSMTVPDNGFNAVFFRILAARRANGPFVPVADTQIVDAAVAVDENDAPSLYFFVEGHMCTETIAGCSGDTVFRTNVVRVDVTPNAGCLTSPTTLCLENGRFQVQAKWHTNDGNSGDGQAIPLTGNSGYFWFFGPDNAEVVVKLLNACATPAPSFWFFASGLTNVGVDLTVTDTKSGATKTYHNPLNQPFAAIQDTSAFSSCP